MLSLEMINHGKPLVGESSSPILQSPTGSYTLLTLNLSQRHLNCAYSFPLSQVEILSHWLLCGWLSGHKISRASGGGSEIQLLLIREPWGCKMGASEAHFQAHLGGKMIPFIDVIFFPRLSHKKLPLPLTSHPDLNLERPQVGSFSHCSIHGNCSGWTVSPVTILYTTGIVGIFKALSQCQPSTEEDQSNA